MVRRGACLGSRISQGNATEKAVFAVDAGSRQVDQRQRLHPGALHANGYFRSHDRLEQQPQGILGEGFAHRLHGSRGQGRIMQ